MKRLFLFFILLISFTALADNKEVELTPKMNNVTVFLNRAQINSTTSTTVSPGYTDIKLQGLSQFIQTQSIQVSGKESFTIMSVKHEVNYLKDAIKSPEMRSLEDSIKILQDEIILQTSMRDIYTKEEQLLVANQQIKGDNVLMDVDELEYMADFFRKRMTSISREKIKANDSINKLSARQKKLQLALQEKNRLYNQPTSTITVTVLSKTTTKASFDIEYIVTNAGWTPIYDLRTKGTSSNVQLAYKAQVYQTTGNDWKNVKLKLSTTNPSLGGTKPELSSWYVNIYEPPVVHSPKRTRGNAAPTMKKMDMDFKAEPATNGWGDLAEEPAGAISDFTTVSETSLSSEFDIAIPYTINTGGNGELVDIQSYDLKADYKHAAVPKMDRDAFLLAMVTGWDDLPLLSGNANIYFEGTYVAESFIDFENTSDTLSLSLGRDNNVIINREQLKDFSSRKTIGSNKKEEQAYQITIRNTKSTAIKITIEDLIPVSRDSRIEVELIDHDGAKYDETRGKLTWDVEVKPGEEKKITFKFSVKYPNNKNVSGI